MKTLIETIKVPRDGNCQFSSIAMGLGADEDTDSVRHSVCTELELCPDLYKPFVEDQEYSEYVNEMKDSGTWGCHVTLIAASRAYCVNIVVFDVEADNFVEVSDDVSKYSKWVILRLCAEHYDYLKMDVKTMETFKKLKKYCDQVPDCLGQLLNVSEPVEYLQLLERICSKGLSLPFLWLYEADLVEEDTFWFWYHKIDDEIRQRAWEFFHWLETAEEE